MKSLNVLILIITFLVVACSTKSKEPKQLTQQEIVKMKVEEFIRSKLNDPDSYEFVELQLKDSVLYSDNIKYRKDMFNKDIEQDQDNLASQLENKKDFPSIYDADEVANLKKDIAKNKLILTAIDSIENALGEQVNEVASYTYYYSFRATNGFGAKVLNEYLLQTGVRPNFEVINLAENMDELYLNPNDFPGYKPMISKYLD